MELFRAALDDPRITKVGAQSEVRPRACSGATASRVARPAVRHHARARARRTRPAARHGLLSARSSSTTRPIPITRLIGEGQGRQKTMRRRAIQRRSRNTPPRMPTSPGSCATRSSRCCARAARNASSTRSRRRCVRVLVDMEREGIALDIAPPWRAFGQTLGDRPIDDGRSRSSSSPAAVQPELAQAARRNPLRRAQARARSRRRPRPASTRPTSRRCSALAGQHADRRTRSSTTASHQAEGHLRRRAARPRSIPPTGRVHTHLQPGASPPPAGSTPTNPNLQNIPIRTEQGREIRKAFVAARRRLRPALRRLLADRAAHHRRAERATPACSRPSARRWTSTPPRPPRSSASRPTASRASSAAQAKMVNFGIPYGISAFGLAQRLGIPRSEADADHRRLLQRSFPASRSYMDRTIANSPGSTATSRPSPAAGATFPTSSPANNTIRDAAERIAINTAHPRHRRRHDQARHDPRSTTTCAAAVCGRNSCCRCTTNSSSTSTCPRRRKSVASSTTHEKRAAPEVPIAIEIGTGDELARGALRRRSQKVTKETMPSPAKIPPRQPPPRLRLGPAGWCRRAVARRAKAEGGGTTRQRGGWCFLPQRFYLTGIDLSRNDAVEPRTPSKFLHRSLIDVGACLPLDWLGALSLPNGQATEPPVRHRIACKQAPTRWPD